MDPTQAATELRGEIEAALADEGVPASTLEVRAVRPPDDLSPGGVFRIEIGRASRRPLTTSLPVTLAMGYLADSESAVDMWKGWIRELADALRP